MDSNHRRHCQQIYSLSPLATREFPHMKFCADWSWWTDSNPRPADYKSAALPTELHQHLTGIARVSVSYPTPERFVIIAKKKRFVKHFFRGRCKPRRKAQTRQNGPVLRPALFPASPVKKQGPGDPAPAVGVFCRLTFWRGPSVSRIRPRRGRP